MLILKSLTRGVMYGYGIAEHIRQLSDEVLRVEEGSLGVASFHCLSRGPDEWVAPPPDRLSTAVDGFDQRQKLKPASGTHRKRR